MAEAGTAISVIGRLVRSVLPSTFRIMPMLQVGPTARVGPVGAGTSKKMERPAKLYRYPRMRFCDRSVTTGNASAVTGRIETAAFPSSYRITPTLQMTAQAPAGFANAASQPHQAPASQLRFLRTVISPMRTMVINGPAKEASSKLMDAAILCHFLRTPFWTQHPTGQGGAVNGVSSR